MLIRRVICVVAGLFSPCYMNYEYDWFRIHNKFGLKTTTTTQIISVKFLIGFLLSSLSDKNRTVSSNQRKSKKKTRKH